MELTKGQEKFQKTISETIVEAWENESFKQELIMAPLETVEKLTGEKLNLKENIKMVVIDQSDKSTFYLNIPHKPSLEDMELSEEQLELVAGGGWLGAAIGAGIGSLGGPLGALTGAYVGHVIEEAIN